MTQVIIARPDTLFRDYSDTAIDHKVPVVDQWMRDYVMCVESEKFLKTKCTYDLARKRCICGWR